MKMKNLLLVTAVVALASTTMLARSPVIPRKGTSILHFFVRKAMVSEGLDTNVVGRVDVKRNRQGNADNQRLNITLTKLDTNVTYQLLAVLGDDTEYTPVTEFTAGPKGSATFRYVSVGASQNTNAGVGRWKTALPAVLDPISDLRALAVADSSTQAVLTADLTVPDKLQYLIKRWLDNDPAYPNAAAELRLSATTNKVQFRLRGYRLEPGLSYLLAVNGGVVDTNTADMYGMLSFTNLPVSPMDILLVRELAIWDSANNKVLSTQLP